MIYGIDISKFQGPLCFRDIEDTHPELKFCIIKSTDGLNYVDPRWNEHKQNMLTSSLYSGSYHFFQPELDPIIQAEFYYARAFGYTQMFPCLDIEKKNLKKDHWYKAQQFVLKTEELWQKPCVIYSYTSFITDIPSDLEAFFAKRPLHVAQYSKDPPTIYHPWKNWTMWQKSGDNAFKLFDKLTIPLRNCQVPCDLNVFNGDLKGFKFIFDLKEPYVAEKFVK